MISDKLITNNLRDFGIVFSILNKAFRLTYEFIDVDDQSLRTILKKEPKKYKLSEFEVLALLGYGTFGSVLLVKYLNEINPYALKIVK